MRSTIDLMSDSVKREFDLTKEESDLKDWQMNSFELWRNNFSSVMRLILIIFGFDTMSCHKIMEKKKSKKSWKLPYKKQRNREGSRETRGRVHCFKKYFPNKNEIMISLMKNYILGCLICKWQTPIVIREKYNLPKLEKYNANNKCKILPNLLDISISTNGNAISTIWLIFNKLFSNYLNLSV